MNRRNQDQLLTELLAGEEAAEFRQASLNRALRGLRRRRRRQEWARASVILLFLAVLAAVSLWPRGQQPVQPRKVAAAQSGGPTVITDDQLLALFPDRPVALIGKPGHQELVFLDETRQVMEERPAAQPQ